MITFFFFTTLIYALFQAILVEYLHVALRPVITVPLLFTRSEVITLALVCLFETFPYWSRFK